MKLTAAAAVIFALAVWVPQAAQAACTNPTAGAGDQFYNYTYNAMQYCNGSVWVNMGSVLGLSTLTPNDFCTTDGTNVFCTTGNPLPVGSGGTGDISFTGNGILMGQGTGALVTIGTAANSILVSNSSGVPGFSTSLPSGVTVGTGSISGVISLANGGTGASLTASNGGIFYSTGSAGAILAGTSTADQILMSGAGSAPVWSTATWPATTTQYQLLYSSATNTITGLATANNSVLATNSSGAPSLSSVLPGAVQGNITATGTIASGTWNGTAIATTYGGLGGNFGSSSGALYITSGAVTAGTLAIANGGTGQTTAQAARGSTSTGTVQGLNIDEMTIPSSSGNTNYQILTTDRTVAVGTTALTAARTWYLPLGSTVNAGQTVCVVDKGGGVNATDTLTIAGAEGSSDTVQPSTSATIKTQYGSACFTSDGGAPAKWTSVGGGGGVPGGSTTDVQFNNNGTLSGDSGFTYAGSGGNIYVEGNVGIGTTNPQEPLHIYTSSGNNTPEIQTAATATAAMIYANGSVSWQAGNAAYGYTGFNFATGSNVVMSLQSSGNVGIGTTAPTNTFHVYGSGFNGGAARFQSTSSGNGVYIQGVDGSGVNDDGFLYFTNGTSAQDAFISQVGTNAKGSGNVGDLRFVTGGSERARISQSTGYVGIGTAAPIQSLQVRAALNQDFFVGGAESLSGGVTIASINDANSGAQPMQINGNPVAFLSGNVGIGTTAPSVLLNVFSNTNTTGFQIVDNFTVGNNSGGSNYTQLQVGQNATSNMYLDVNNQSNTKGNLLILPWGGNVGIGTTNPLTYALDVIGALNVSGAVTCGSGCAAGPWVASGSTIVPTAADLSYNIGIGTTAPDAMLTINAGASEALRLVNSNSNPFGLMINNTTFGYGDSKGVGFYQANNGRFGIYNNNILAFNIDSFGNVGIGTTVPTAMLTVNGNLTLGSAPTILTTSGNLTLQTSGGTQAVLDNTNGTFNAARGFYTSSGVLGTPGTGLTIDYASGARFDSAAGYQFWENSFSTEPMVINSSGQVGIGTTGPAYSLEVENSGASQLHLDSSSGITGLYLLGLAGTNGWITTGAYYNGSHWIATSATPSAMGMNQNGMNFVLDTGQTVGSTDAMTTRMVILNNGNVGIGTTAPGFQLSNNATNNIDSASTGLSSNGSIDWANNAAGYAEGLYNASSNSAADGLLVKIDGTASTNRIFELETGSSQGSAGTEVMTVQGSGNIGIGTTVPQAMLQVGYANSSVASNGAIIVGNSTGSGDYRAMKLGYDSDYNFGFFDSGSTEQFSVNYAAPANSLSVNSSGYVGVGVASAQAPLDVQGQLSFSGNSNQSGSVNRIATSGNTGWMTINSPNALYLNNLTAATVYISSDGGATVIGGPMYAQYITQTYGNYIYPGRNDGSGGNYQTTWYLASNASWGLFTNSSMYFAGGIYQAQGAYVYPGCNGCGGGQTSYFLYDDNGDSGIHTNGNFLADGNIYVGYLGWLSNYLNQSVTSGSSPNFWDPYIGYMGTNLSNWINQNLTTGAAPTFADLYVSGIIETYTEPSVSGPTQCRSQSSGEYGDCASDARVKTDVRPLTDKAGLSVIEALRPVSFNWNKKFGDPKPVHYGFLAQDVLKVLPSLVSKGDATALTPGGTYSLDYNGFAAPLVKAVQELKSDNDNLRVALKAANDNESAQMKELRDLLAKQQQEFDAYRKVHP